MSGTSPPRNPERFGVHIPKRDTTVDGVRCLRNILSSLAFYKANKWSQIDPTLATTGMQASENAVHGILDPTVAISCFKE